MVSMEVNFGKCSTKEKITNLRDKGLSIDPIQR